MAPLISHIDDYRQLRSTFKKKKKKYTHYTDTRPDTIKIYNIYIIWYCCLENRQQFVMQWGGGGGG